MNDPLANGPNSSATVDLSGVTHYSPCDIIKAWLHSPDGRLDRESDLMYSTTTPYAEIKSVRPCLTSFGAQIVQEELVREAKSAVEPCKVFTLDCTQGIGWHSPFDVPNTSWGKLLTYTDLGGIRQWDRVTGPSVLQAQQAYTLTESSFSQFQ